MASQQIIHRLLALRSELDSILQDFTAQQGANGMLEIQAKIQRGEQVELGPSPTSPKSYYEFYKSPPSAPNAPKKLKTANPNKPSKEELESLKESAEAIQNQIQEAKEPKKIVVSKKVLKRTDAEILKVRVQAEKDAEEAVAKNKK
jgi:type IV secretory pathway VirB10-like protein